MSLQINKRQFKKWIAALDSGEYKQERCHLQANEGYCCLGVACVVTIPDKLIVLDVLGQIKGGMPDDQPSAPVWLKSISGNFGKKTGRDLVSLNDSGEYTFPEIATVLELVYIHKILD